MGNKYMPDRELFDENILIVCEYNKDVRCDLYGLCSVEEENIVIPCIYKSILSHKNGFARAIDLSGRLVYVSDTGEHIFDYELPFVKELCDDFDEHGHAKIACLVDEVFIVKGYMDADGTMFLKGYNCSEGYDLNED